MDKNNESQAKRASSEEDHPVESNLESNQDSLENDAVWNLLKASPPPQASPAFLQNTLRQIRLAEASKTTAIPIPWWKKILTPRPLAASAAALAFAACVALLIITNLPKPSATNPSPDLVVDTPSEPATSPLAELQDSLADELLITAAENPSLFTDQEVLALLY